jgi:hypothetical protein
MAGRGHLGPCSNYVEHLLRLTRRMFKTKHAPRPCSISKIEILGKKVKIVYQRWSLKYRRMYDLEILNSQSPLVPQGDSLMTSWKLSSAPDSMINSISGQGECRKPLVSVCEVNIKSAMFCHLLWPYTLESGKYILAWCFWIRPHLMTRLF